MAAKPGRCSICLTGWFNVSYVESHDGRPRFTCTSNDRHTWTAGYDGEPFITQARNYNVEVNANARIRADERRAELMRGT